jgi:hypothetical protein
MSAALGAERYDNNSNLLLQLGQSLGAEYSLSLHVVPETVTSNLDLLP